MLTTQQTRSPSATRPKRVAAKRAKARGATSPLVGAWNRARPVRASDEIVRQVRKALFAGTLRPGDSLGAEHELATQYGVSRVTIRDAIRALETSGVVEIKTGVKGGVRVAQGDPYRFADALAVQLKLVGLNPEDARAAQLGLEWVATELAAERATLDDLANLQQLIEMSERTVDAPEEFAELSMAFHDAMATASHNWAIITNLRAIREIVGESRARNTTTERALRIVGHHRSIYEAIRERKVAKAGQLARQHIGVIRAKIAIQLTREPSSNLPEEVRTRLQPVSGSKSGFARIRFLRFSDEIVKQIRRAVFEERLRAGDALGSLSDLQMQFGVSRATVRDAVRALEASGLIEIRSGATGGVRVASGDPFRFAEALAIQLKLVGLDTWDATAVGLGLEWVAAELAAQYASAEDLAEMEALLCEGEQMLHSNYASAQLNLAFHEAIARASHNWAITANLRAVVELLGESYARITTPERSAEVLRAHRAILQAIRDHDSESAVGLMRQHIHVARSAAKPDHSGPVEHEHCA